MSAVGLVGTFLLGYAWAIFCFEMGWLKRWRDYERKDKSGV